MLRSPKQDRRKLDKLFFDFRGNEVRGRELVQAIISLAKLLHMETVAEGIEEEGEVRWLQEIGCVVVQGYVYAKPMPVDDFMRFLEQRDGSGTGDQAG